VRCLHCVIAGDYAPMVAFKDGRFVCIWCAHTVRFDDEQVSMLLSPLRSG